MNDDSTTTLRQAAERLEPDVDRLVAGGTARGRRLRRRRRVGASLATVAAVGIVTVSIPLLDNGGSGPTGTEVASDPTPSVSETTPPAAPEPRVLAVTQAQVPDTFAELVPGEITEWPQKEVRDESPIVDFQWNGFAARVGIVPDDYRTGEPENRTPMEMCQRYGQPGLTCQVLPDGTVAQTNTWLTPGGREQSWANAFLPDGWEATAFIHNAATKESPALTAHPPLTPQQLLDVLLSDAWFQ